MIAKLGVLIAVLLVSASWVSEAVALPTRHAPEIDGAGALAVIALVMSLGAILYSKVRK